MKFYAVAKGHKPGIYPDFETYTEQMKGFSGAVGKKFKSYEAAAQFVSNGNAPPPPNTVAAALAEAAANAAAAANAYNLPPPGNALPGPVTFAAVGAGANRKEWHYAVAKGRSVGIYRTWAECKKHVDNFPFPKYRKFRTEAEAVAFIQDYAVAPITPQAVSTSTSAAALPTTTVAAPPRTTPTAAASSKPQPPTTNRKRPHAPEQPLASKRARSIEIISPPPFVTDKPPAKKRVKTEGMSPPPPASDSPSAPVVYTDGACSKNGKDGAKAGYGVFWGDDHPDNVGAPVNGTATNNQGEFLGAIVAIRQAVNRGFKRLTLCTDSQLLIKSVTQWMPNWKRRGWKKGDGSPVLNVDLIQVLDVLTSKIQVTWKYVPGHANIHGNEMADQLAREGAKKYS